MLVRNVSSVVVHCSCAKCIIWHACNVSLHLLLQRWPSACGGGQQGVTRLLNVVCDLLGVPLNVPQGKLPYKTSPSREGRQAGCCLVIRYIGDPAVVFARFTYCSMQHAPRKTASLQNDLIVSGSAVAVGPSGHASQATLTAGNINMAAATVGAA
jgi:hypothetical protein